MDTSPKDQAALRHDAPAPPPRAPRPGEHLWTLRKHGARMDAELRDDTGADAGAELQLLRDGAFVYGRRLPSRAMAIDEAEGCRREFEADGWRPE
jgi:hypothetical protein